MLLKQIFVHEGQPIRMHIDSSIANVNVRATLSTRIMVSRYSGGSLMHFVSSDASDTVHPLWLLSICLIIFAMPLTRLLTKSTV